MLKQTDFFGGPTEPNVHDPLPAFPSDAEIAQFARDAPADTVLAVAARRLRRSKRGSAAWARAAAVAAPSCASFGRLVVALDAAADEPTAGDIGAEVVRRVQSGGVAALDSFEAEALASALERAVWDHLNRREPDPAVDSLAIALLLVAGDTRGAGTLGPVVYADQHATDPHVRAAARDALERRGVIAPGAPVAPDAAG